jgi:hypothetical protein
MPAEVEKLMEGAGATREFFAASGTGIYDITAGGAVGAAALGSLTNARFQHLMFSNSGGNYLVCVNGADGVITYDGTTWTTQTITGVDPDDLFQIASWKSRLWFAEKSSTSAWYLGTDAIAGAATELNLGGVWRLGGTLARIISTSYDTSAGPQDYIGFLSTNGEVAVYQGTDPSTAATFSLVGVYLMGAPVGDRCTYQSGGDTVIITNDGALSLLEMMRVGDRAAAPRASITDRISLAFTADVERSKNEFGWQIVGYPANHLAIINVPDATGPTKQYIMNTVTGAWARWLGHNAACWGLLNNNLFFGSNSAGKVYRADFGETDDGNAISWSLKTAFQRFGDQGGVKRLTMMMPIMRVKDNLSFGIGVDVDYGDADPDATFNALSAAAVWDVDLWNLGVWGGTRMVRDWVAVMGVGRVASVMMRGSTVGAELEINAFYVIAEPARGLAL